MSIIYTTLERLESSDPVTLRATEAAILTEPEKDNWHKMGMAAALMALAIVAALAFLYLQRNIDADGNTAKAQHLSGAKPNVVSEGYTAMSVPVAELTLPPAATNPTREDSAAMVARAKKVDPPLAAIVDEPAAVDTLDTPSSAVPEQAEPTASTGLATTNPANLAPPATEDSNDAAAVQPSVSKIHLLDNVLSENAIDDARRALAIGNYWGALKTLESLQPKPDKRADFWLIRGSAHLATGQLDLADADLQSARRLMPKNAQIIVQQAVLAQERGNHAAAIAILDDAASANPGVPEIFLNLGFSQQALGALPQARRSFGTFLRLTEHRSLYAEQRQAVKEWLMPAATIGNEPSNRW